MPDPLDQRRAAANALPADAWHKPRDDLASLQVLDLLTNSEEEQKRAREHLRNGEVA